jgi:hypothetical protein
MTLGVGSTKRIKHVQFVFAAVAVGGGQHQALGHVIAAMQG